MTLTRRELGRLFFTLPATGLLARDAVAAMLAGKPDSNWGGVQVGMNVPYNYGGVRTMPVDEVIAKTVQLGISAVELRSQPIELALGAPMSMLQPTGDKAAQQQAAEHLRAWRVALDPDRAKAVRQQFNDAGIKTPAIKFDGIYDFSDPELDYAFQLAKAMDANAISCELELAGARRVGQFADKHQLMVGYHGHTKTTEAMFVEAFSYARYNGANLDIGHYIAGNLGDPVAFIEKHHDRITHIHVKDRLKQQADGKDGDNMPFGQGDTPIGKALQTIRDHKWPIQATIEFEYKVPAGSDRMAEMAKCVEFCKQALLAK
jgi:sugar phosphate isomerase/epimerase